MIFPVAKIFSGLVAVGSTATSKCTTNGSLQATIGRFATNSAAVGTSSGIVSSLPMGVTSKTLDALLKFRGGSSTGEVFNISRESLFLQGMATYGTITALIMNASLRMWTSTNISKKQKKIVSNVFNTATALCLLSGVFTAILFQLLTIYSKSALGMGNDSGYIAFKSATSAFRKWGFRCFLTEMWSFVISFIVRLYNSLWDDARLHETASTLTPTGNIIMGGSLVLMAFGVFFIRAVLKLASQHIY